MIDVRKSGERGYANHGWLDTRYSFSFADYYDPSHMGFGPLRVINEDYIAAHSGFGTHPHRDMEIITYIIDGELTHTDNMGHKGTIGPGLIQKMSAGTGVLHSEYNHSDRDVHLLQIWIVPHTKSLAPMYEEFAFDRSRNRLTLLACEGEGGVTLYQHLSLYRAELDGGETLTSDLTHGCGWLQLISGSVTLNGVTLEAGDGAAIAEESKLRITASEDAHFLLFDFRCA